jgi:invasion protein IalB
MRRIWTLFAAGMVLSALTVGMSALNAQQRPKAPAKVETHQQSAAAPTQPHTPAATEHTNSVGPGSGSNWRVECSNDGKALDCRAVQQVVTRENQQLIAGLMVRVPAETKKPVMMVHMPLGVMVSEPVGFIVDEGKPENFQIQTCNSQGCFVGTPLADVLLAAMLNGKRLRIVFQNGNKQAVTVTMPLAGFGLAYDKVKG